jgi:uncharacterized protein YbgA (DUF1722 family)
MVKGKKINDINFNKLLFFVLGLFFSHLNFIERKSIMQVVQKFKSNIKSKTMI